MYPWNDEPKRVRVATWCLLAAMTAACCGSLAWLYLFLRGDVP